MNGWQNLPATHSTAPTCPDACKLTHLTNQISHGDIEFIHMLITLHSLYYCVFLVTMFIDGYSEFHYGGDCFQAVSYYTYINCLYSMPRLDRGNVTIKVCASPLAFQLNT